MSADEPSLFDLDSVSPKPRRRTTLVDPSSTRVVRVLPDVPAVERSFDYAVPADWTVAGPSDRFRGGPREVGVGTRVRVSFSGRRVGGWVTEVGVDAESDRGLQPVAKVSGLGPAAEIFDLAAWAADRWAGRPSSFLRTASPEGVVGGLPRRAPASRTGLVGQSSTTDLLDAFSAPLSLLQWPPGLDVWPVVAAALSLGNALILTPGQAHARRLSARARSQGSTVAVLPSGWALAAAGASVIGSRAAAWAPMTDLAAVVVLDEHDGLYQEERTPTWHARDVAIERARRAGVPCVLVSPVPSLAARHLVAPRRPSRSTERQGWPVVDVVDTRDAEPGQALFSRTFVDRLRGDHRVVCVLNRTGRARLLSCGTCGDLAQCDVCAAAMQQHDEGHLDCGRCGHRRPTLCLRCGPTRLKLVRLGVSRAREELEALVREPVAELTASAPAGSAASSRVVIGTTAVLHQVERAGLVAFLDFDQELLSTRYRAVEQAHGLVARAASLTGGRSDGRLIIQTRLPDHEVARAARAADPDLVAESETSRRRDLGFPPFAALAMVSGPAAAAYMDRLGEPEGVDVLADDDRWLVRAPTWDGLGAVLRSVKRPAGRLRIEVDPPGA